MTTPDPHSHDTQLDALVAHYIEAIERGEIPDREKLIAENPALADGLRRFFTDYDRLQLTNLQTAAQHVNPEATFIPQHEPQPGTIFGGRYKLLQNIGEGGMGSVWVAEQKEPVKRKVAIKLVKAGMDSKQVLARFEAERQALAMMDHPNIAKVFDGGITEHGRPYFVMEYVKGVPFTEYCDKARLSLKERLNLFIPVCQAVQHAHHKGIVHRDLKPSNILICLYDGKPVPKVIDFGLAKAMHQQLTEQSIFTAHGVMVGTPLYMSPEQAEHNNLDVDTRTDIYSLGVVLYELLTGTTPLEREQLRTAAYNEVLRLIKEVEPPRPSTRLSGSNSLPSIAAQRSIDPRHLQRSVAGDLDWIVMKSLEKERSRRYETATGFARDIERFLNEEAVEAFPPSPSYRLKKFIRKHRAQVIAGSAIVFALVAGITGATWGWFRAQKAETELTNRNNQLKHGIEEIFSASFGRVKPNPSGVLWVNVDVNHELSFGFTTDEVGTLRTKAQGADATGQEMAEAYLWTLAVNESVNGVDALKQALIVAEQAEKEVLAQRDLAERKLAEGILRPIGDGDDLHAFVDWSAIPDSRLKLQVLEIAFEDPVTALRVARRAKRAIQACVAISPIRRAKAIELVAAKQRDRQADPRIRVAACWIAMELGSADIPALSESIAYLSNPDKRLQKLFSEYTHFAVQLSGTDLRSEIDRVFPPMLIEILERSADMSSLETAEDGLESLANRLSPDLLARSQNAVIRLMDKTFDQRNGYRIGHSLAAFAPELRPAQVQELWSAIAKRLLTSSHDHEKLRPVVNCLLALTNRLSQEASETAANDIIAVFETAHDDNIRTAACEILVQMSPILTSDAVEKTWKILADISTTQTVSWSFSENAGELTKLLAAKLSKDQVRAQSDALLSSLEKTNDKHTRGCVTAILSAVTPLLSHAETTRAWDALGTLGASLDHEDWWTRNDGMEVMAPYLSFAKLKQILSETDESVEFEYACKGLKSCRGELSTPQVEECIAILFRHASSESKLRFEAADGLASLASRMDFDQLSLCWEELIQKLNKSSDPDELLSTGEILSRLAPHLDESVVVSRFESLLKVVENSKDAFAKRAATAALVALAQRLNAFECSRIGNIVIGQLQESSDQNVSRECVKHIKCLCSYLSFDQLTQAVGILQDIIKNEDHQVSRGTIRRSALDLIATLAVRLTREQKMALLKWMAQLLPEADSGDIATCFRSVAEQLSADDSVHDVTNAVHTLLDLHATSETYFYRGFGAGDHDTSSVGVLAFVLRDPKSLADLLRHPGCCESSGDFLIQRFEELVFHNGERVFLALPTSEGDTLPQSAMQESTETAEIANGGLTPNRTPESPLRRFHTMHDAAVWIQQNWPDFDLEATHPVTWRGER